VGGLSSAVASNDFNNLESGKCCRICLDEDDDSKNPFITPCKCQGSTKFIHVNCIRAWLDTKKQSQKLDGVYSYYWEELTCDICKDPLKLRNQVVELSKDGPFKYTKEYFLLNFKVPFNEKYMVIESDVNCLSKAIHVINFDLKKDYNVGRRITNDVTVSDISVSRAQASIKLRQGKVYIQDCDSKFGTFVKIKGLYPIDEKSENVVPIQVEKKCFFIRT
jgi:hypothetical protein